MTDSSNKFCYEVRIKHAIFSHIEQYIYFMPCIVISDRFFTRSRIIRGLTANPRAVVRSSRGIVEQALRAKGSAAPLTTPTPATRRPVHGL